MKLATTSCVAILGLLICCAASAADLTPGLPAVAPPSFTPAPLPRVYNWSGLYMGAIGGASAGIARHQSSDLTFDTDNFRVEGGLVGASFGMSYQTGAWVWGLDGDVEWTLISGSQTAAGFPFSAKLDWLSTFRARVGYAFDRFLPYLSVGPAFGGLAVQAAIPGMGPVSGSGGRSGWALNLGLE